MRKTLHVVVLASAFLAANPVCWADEATGERNTYRDAILPLLQQHCYDCHADGVKKGNMSLDEFESEEALLNDHDLWWAIVQNVRTGIMPPQGKSRPTADQFQQLNQWVKTDVLGIDLEDPDPGKVTIRRLNRIEYANTIRDLMDYTFDSKLEFPPDDTGFGFDNIGDVLSLSPLLMEKYIKAAETIVTDAVPTVARLMDVQSTSGRDFRSADSSVNGDRMDFYTPATVSRTFTAGKAGTYRIAVRVRGDGAFDFDPGRCHVHFTINGEERFEDIFIWEEREVHDYHYEERWEAGEYEFKFDLRPLSALQDKKNNLEFRIVSVRVEGPIEREHWVKPHNYDRFFPNNPVPEETSTRDDYARDVLRRFATRAFRRPVDEATLTRLVGYAKATYRKPEKRFEEGIAQAMKAVLASPRFLFRIERAGSVAGDSVYPYLDDYSLASRLSYFFWSTMPDETLFELAEQGNLRTKLQEQVKRLSEDRRSQALVENFIGQWLQARNVGHVSINSRAVLNDGRVPQRRRRPSQAIIDPNDSVAVAKAAEERQRRREEFAKRRRVDFNAELRAAMRRETEMLFSHIMQEDRCVLELIDADYTFLNERLAQHYGIPGVEGRQMRKVDLPADSHRGGILTQGTFLTVTSNPTRTSAVKRGLFISENILGIPVPPAPGNVPLLEEAEKAFDHDPTIRDMMELHRSNRLCSSCHARFDPLGMALENFNALGMWRDTERGQPIDASGELITGETFAGVDELKRILVDSHRADFYRSLTEHLLIYALGRGLEVPDEHTVDTIVEQLLQEAGRFSILLQGIIYSAPFQKQRMPSPSVARPTPLNDEKTSDQGVPL